MCAKLFAVLLCGLLSGCGGASNQKPAVTLIIKAPDLQMSTYADHEISMSAEFLQKAADAFAAQYEDSDVTVKLVAFEYVNEDREISQSFDTTNAADVLYEDYFNMSTYIHTGRMVPLDDIISDELRSDIDQGYWENSMLNGKTYMMPFLSRQNTMSFNVDLFRQAGLDEFISGDNNVVQNWTLDEWNYILQTLRAKLPELIHPMMMYAGNNQGDTHIMTLLRSHGSTFFDENGRVCLNTPEGVAALQWLKDCCDKDYFPTGADTMEITDNYNQFINQMLVLYVNNDVQEEACRKEGSFEIQSVNFPSIDGDGYATTFITGFGVFDNGDEAKLAAAKAFVKFIYESNFINYMAGSIPCSSRVAETYAAELKNISKYIDNSAANVNFTENNPNWRGVREAFYPNIQDLLFGDKTPAEVAASIDADCNAAIEAGYANSKLHD